MDEKQAGEDTINENYVEKGIIQHNQACGRSISKRQNIAETTNEKQDIGKGVFGMNTEKNTMNEEKETIQRHKEGHESKNKVNEANNKKCNEDTVDEKQFIQEGVDESPSNGGGNQELEINDRIFHVSRVEERIKHEQEMEDAENERRKITLKEEEKEEPFQYTEEQSNEKYIREDLAQLTVFKENKTFEGTIQEMEAKNETVNEMIVDKKTILEYHADAKTMENQTELLVFQNKQENSEIQEKQDSTETVQEYQAKSLEEKLINTVTILENHSVLDAMQEKQAYKDTTNEKNLDNDPILIKHVHEDKILDKPTIGGDHENFALNTEHEDEVLKLSKCNLTLITKDDLVNSQYEDGIPPNSCLKESSSLEDSVCYISPPLVNTVENVPVEKVKSNTHDKQNGEIKGHQSKFKIQPTRKHQSKSKTFKNNNAEEKINKSISSQAQIPGLSRKFVRLHHISYDKRNLYGIENIEEYKFNDGTLLFAENEKIRQVSHAGEIIMDLHFTQKEDYLFRKRDRLTYQYFNTNVGFARSRTQIHDSNKDFIFDRKNRFETKSFSDTLRRMNMNKVRESSFLLPPLKINCKKTKAYANLQKKLSYVLK